MLRKYIAVVVVLIAGTVAASFGADAPSGVMFSAYGIAIGTSASSSYNNLGGVGSLSLNTSLSTGFRSYAGALTAHVVSPVMSVIDNSIVFLNADPSAADVQSSAALDFRVTVQITGGNSINDFSYQVSTWGVAGLAAAPFLTNAATETVTNAATIRYRVSFPNSGGAVFLAPGDNNYVRCLVNNDAGANMLSSPFQIRVSTSPQGGITILQPDAKSGVASIAPYFKAVVNGSSSVDPALVTLKIDDANGVTIKTVTPSYDASRRTISYKYDGVPALVSGATYKATVALNADSDSVIFKVKAGAIADLVPYPSPFDPKKQPVTIRYALNKTADVSINLYDRAGRLVWNVIDNQPRPAGISEETWNGGNYAGETLANGVYFCEIVVKDDEGEHRSHTAIVIFGK